jgi:ubiquinone/menaquinone biosynthesis C-methylase UbiE
MPDVWASVAELDADTQERLAAVLETRGADPQQQAMRRAFLDDIAIPAGSSVSVLDVGCGTGVLTRMAARLPGVARVIGVDPAPTLLAKARQLSGDAPNITFQEADARALPFADATFDVVIFDSTLSHVPGPDEALAEAFRVSRQSGWLAVFDGDYATTTVALGDHDPLQTAVDMMMAHSVHDRWLVRRLPALVRRAGFDTVAFRSHGFVEPTGGYMRTIVERGVDLLVVAGQISAELGSALTTEATRRVEAGSFFGHIAYGSLTARKPSPLRTTTR